jgi:hypothetical protein
MIEMVLPWLPSTACAAPDEVPGSTAACEPRAGPGDRASTPREPQPATAPLPSDHAQLRAASLLWREATRRFRERVVQQPTPSPGAGGGSAAEPAGRGEPSRHRQ